MEQQPSSNHGLATKQWFPPKDILKPKDSTRQKVPAKLLPLLFIFPMIVLVVVAFLITYSGDEDSKKCNPDISDLIFAPDRLFGNFTIGQARAIDLSWNLVVGRGAQAITGVLLYRTATDALLRITEHVPVSYGLFSTLAFEPFSIYSVAPLAKAVSQIRGWRARSTLVWLLLSVGLIVGLPTFLDITTGYAQRQLPYIRFPNGTLEVRDLALNRTVLECDLMARNKSEGDVQKEYKLRDDCRERFNNFRVECVAQDGYMWGYSLAWAVALMVILIIWNFGIYVMWADASQHSELRRRGRKMGRWRAILDLAHAVQEELGPWLDGYSEGELRGGLAKASPIMYATVHDLESEVKQVVLTSQALDTVAQPEGKSNLEVVHPSVVRSLKTLRIRPPKVQYRNDKQRLDAVLPTLS